jgi:TetR/AcrR family transcriptional regulator
MNVQLVKEVMLETPKLRNADRSKDTILQAATSLFSQHGFEATTMQMVAEKASVARGTPSYFFVSKEKLFQAVLERESQKATLVVPDTLEQLGSNSSPEMFISILVDTYLDFLNDNPTFLRLIQWTALERPQLMQDVNNHWQTILQANQAARMVWVNASEDDIKHLTLSVIGMCSFHFFFGDVIGQHLDINPNTAEFLQKRKEHIRLFLLSALKGISQ